MTNISDFQEFKGIRLAEFHVEKLFDEFTYTIKLNLSHHVTAIIAPNGTGKTLCLKLINALFKNKWSFFRDTVFSTATYTFTDGSIVKVDKKKSEASSEDRQITNDLIIKLGCKGIAEPEWTPKSIRVEREFQFERFVPFMTRIGPDRWVHDHSGEIYTTSEIVETYGDSFPPNIRAKMYGKPPPERLVALTRQIDCRLIEAQRLVILSDEDETPVYARRGRPRSTLAITKKAQALKDIISKEINAYATLSQSLDRSFPKRVIHTPKMLSPDDLEAQLESLDKKRGELMEAGILDKEADDPVSLPAGTLEPAISHVLSVYVEDTKKKLESLSTILAKIKLFKLLIDQRFITKDVQISKEQGIDVTFKTNRVSLEKLSSGEQHQLVLFFELLFEIRDNSLILIDEPELSLHVTWQKKFISDLLKIIELNRFDVVLATHSPQLLGRWSDLVVELGDIYEGNKPDDENGRS